jgi:hypothetical protein
VIDACGEMRPHPDREHRDQALDIIVPDHDGGMTMLIASEWNDL